MPDRTLHLGTLFTAEGINTFIAQLNKLKGAMAGAQKAYVGAGKSADKAFTGAAAGVSKTTKSIQKSGKATLAYTKQIAKVEGAWQRVLAAMKVTASYGLAATGIFAITASVREGIKEIVEYDQALKNLQAITRATDNEVVGMGNTIKEVAETTKFSTAEVAEGMVLLGQAGFTASEAMDAMQSTADLATGTLSDMKITADLLTTTVRAFGLDAAESTRVADVMANAINRSKLTLEKLRIAFNFVGAAASQTGLSLEETAASMMVLANNGLRASTIGTGLRQVMARLLAPSRKLREAFKDFGVELDKVNPRIVGWQNAMEEVRKILVDQEKQTIDMGKAYELFGLRGAQAAAILARSFGDPELQGSFQSMLDKTYEMGSAAAMASLQAEGLGIKIKNLADRFKLIFVAIGEAGATGVIGGFIDVLRGLSTAIARLVSSDLGKFATSMTIWAATISIATKAIFVLSSILTSALLPALARPITKLVVFIQYLGQLTRAFGISAAASTVFQTAMAGSLTVLGPIAVAIGAIIAAWRWYDGTIQRAVQSTSEIASETKKNADTLNLYAISLEKLRKKQIEGEDVTRDYQRALSQVEQAFEDSKEVLDESTDSILKNIEALKSLASDELQKNIKANVELYQLYGEQAEYNTLKTALWEAATRILFHQFERIVTVWKKLSEYEDRVFSWVGEQLEAIERILRKVIPGFDFLSESFAKLMSLTSKGKDILLGPFIKLGKESAKTKEALESQEQVVERLAQAYKESGQSVEEYIKTLRESGAGEDLLKNVNEAIQKQREQMEITKTEWKETLTDMPDAFKEFYNELDTLRQVDFIKSVKKMNNELAAFEKMAKQIGAKQEDIEAGKQTIRARALLAFRKDKEKELATEEEFNQKILDVYDRFKEEVRNKYEERSRNLDWFYWNELDKAAGNQEKILELDEDYNERKKVLAEDLIKDLAAIDQAYLATKKEYWLENVEELAEVHGKLLEDIGKQLKRDLDDLKKEYKDLTQGLMDIELDWQADIRDLRQKTMTDEQKWYDDRKRVRQLHNQAIRTGDSDLFKEAIKLAKSLSREVTNEQGKVVKSVEDTTGTAIGLVNKIYTDLRRQQEEDLKKTEEKMKGVSESITTIKQAVEEYGKQIDEVSKKELALKTQKTIENVIKAHDITSKFKTEWDSIIDKVVTLEVQIKKAGKIAEFEEKGLKVTGEGEGKKIGVEGTDKVSELNQVLIAIQAKIDEINNIGIVSGTNAEVVTNVKESMQELVDMVNNLPEVEEGGIIPFDLAIEDVENIDQLVQKMNDYALALEGNRERMELLNRAKVEGFDVTLIQNAKLSVDEFGQSVDQLNTKPLALDTTPTVQSVNAATSATEAFKSIWDSLKSKVITLTVNTVQKGGGGKSLEPGAPTPGGSGKKEGGFVTLLREGGKVYKSFSTKIFTNVIKKAQGGGIWKYLVPGGKLSGFGGGDIVKALLEPGEWVIRKEAVLKYGKDIFDKFNKMVFPVTSVPVGSTASFAPSGKPAGDGAGGSSGSGGPDVAARQGGLLSTIISRNLTKMQVGGSVHKSLSNYSNRFSKSWNNMSYDTYSPVKAFKAQTGGMVINVPTPNFKIPHFQGGGSVDNSKSTSNLTIKIKPMFMSGDRKSAREFAVYIKKELDNLNARWGNS
jgi:TP901 family phage tail tape measure protein